MSHVLSPQTQLKGNAPSSCLPEDRSKPEGREGLISPFTSIPYPKPQESKVSLIRREFVELTNNPLMAAVLNQLVYWSQRVADFELFWEEESSYVDTPSSQHGWFYKSASELLEETMIRVTPITMRRYLSFLMEQGWIQTRVNPRYKWDRTIQYRVNLRKLYTDLQTLGFGLPGFPAEAFPAEAIFLPLKKEHEEKTDSSKDQNLSFATTKNFSPSKKLKKPACIKNVPSNLQNLTLDKKENLPSNRTVFSSQMEKNVGCNTEIITENTNREHTQRTRVRAAIQKNFFEEVLNIWNTCLSQGGPVPSELALKLPPIQLTDERRRKIHALFPLYFENDLEKWQSFCERVAYSPFLMGQGARKWRVSLDWILVEENLLKVLEGNFDDGKLLDQKIEKAFDDARTKEIHTVLKSIADPMWRDWCSQLNFSSESHNYVSLLDLKAIAPAKFLEVEDDRLVWVGSSDKRTLSKIEDLRLKILPIVERTFPHARNVRTRLMSERDFFHQTETPDSSQVPDASHQHIGDVHYA